MISIYTISCPTTDNVVYVGQTDNFNRRVSMHLKMDEGNKKSNWIKDQLSKGLKPKFKIVELVETKKEALQIEVKLIKDFLSKGVQLLNTNYKKDYYKYDMDGNFIGVIIGICGDESNIRIDRLTYLGHVYNTEPIFPKWKVDEYRRSKSVRRFSVHQYSKCGKFIKTYFGVREAGRITGIDHRSIAQVAGGSKVRKSAGGYIWKYKKN